MSGAPWQSRQQERSCGMTMREWRHSPCLMSPLAIIMILVVALLWLLTMLLKFPAFIIGLVLQPLASKFNLIVEFMYPSAIGRWVHFFILRLADRSRKSKPTDKSYGYHTRAMESRFEIVPKRVYVHPLPQLIDNLGYLVVCVPPPRTNGKILAFCVDVGDAAAVMRQIAIISNLHYDTRKIHVHSIMSTHKHHDHTAGNRGFKRHREYGRDLKLIFGGAVENVPCCNFLLSNGDKLPLPRDGRTDMHAFIEVEAVATPGHTRGSLAYVMRVLKPNHSSVAAVIFTGDTMFSGGGGVPFEADFDKKQEEKVSKMNGSSYIKASAATYAVERCFAEILFRSVSFGSMRDTTGDRVVMFPGHEYTYELLNRQLTQTTENCRWKNFTPAVFFDTMSHLYVAMHRRTLPLNSGKLLVAPSPITREVKINPHLRSLRKRGEVVVSALLLWNQHFSKNPVRSETTGGYGRNASNTTSTRQSTTGKTKTTERAWNLDGQDLNRSVFTTVYSEDFESVISELDGGSLDPRSAAKRLRLLQTRLDIPPIGRRPIPGTLPADRQIFKGLLGFALLGSSPSALKPSDSTIMKLPAPIGRTSDSIVVSKKRLIAVLYWLGLLTDEFDGKRVVEMIERLWNEASDLESTLTTTSDDSSEEGEPHRPDIESTTTVTDGVDLGSLKWLMYGIPPERPSFFPQFCSPCQKPSLPNRIRKKHPVRTSGMQQDRAELVRHDVFTCLICRSATGCFHTNQQERETSVREVRDQVYVGQASTDDVDNDDEEGSFIEVTPEGFGAI